MFKLPKIKLQKYEYDYLFGSRKVIKDANAEQNHFYTPDAICTKRTVNLPTWIKIKLIG